MGGKLVWSRDVRLLALLAGAVTFLVYLPALDNGFVSWDDDGYVYRNPFIQQLSTEFFYWAFTAFHSANWHPLTWISHAVDYAIWGLNPLGHHLTSVILHSLNTVLVVLLAQRVLTHRALAGGAGPRAGLAEAGVPLAALLCGLLFGLHPLHVESVAWVSERKDLLCAFFYLLSLLAYLRLWRAGPADGALAGLLRNRYYLACLLLFALALMSKPMAISLPVVLLLIDWLQAGGGRGVSWGRALVAKAPFFALALASALATLAAQGSGDAISSLAEVPLFDRIWVAGHALVAYLAKMLWPVDLLPFYPYPDQVDWASARYLLPALLVPGLTAFALLKARRWRGPAVAWAYYLVTLLPVLGIVKVGGQAMADRYTYLPSIAPFMLFSAALVWAVGLRAAPANQATARLWPGAVVAAVISGALAVMTLQQIPIWKSGDALWRYAIEKDPAVARPHKQLGKGLAERGDYRAATEALEQAVKLDPADYQTLSLLAICYLELGELDRAQAAVSEALRLKADDAPALNTLGEIYLARADYARANEVFLRAMQLEPKNPLRLFNLAVSFDKLNDSEQACRYWRRYMEVDLSGRHDDEILDHLEELGCPAAKP